MSKPRVEAPPSYTLAYAFFECAAELLGEYVEWDGSAILVKDLKGYAERVERLAEDNSGVNIWFSGNDKQFRITKKGGVIKGPLIKAAEALGMTIRGKEDVRNVNASTIVKLYARTVGCDAGSIEKLSKVKVSCPALFKVTLYEYGKGFGSFGKEEVKLDLNQLSLSLLGAMCSKLATVRIGNQLASVYYLPLPAAAISIKTFTELRKRLRGLGGSVFAAPEAVKCLLIAEVALRLGDLSDDYGEELLITIGGNRATLFRRSRVTSYGLARALKHAVSGSEQDKMLECMRLILTAYYAAYGRSNAERLVSAITRYAEALLCYVQTGSKDYQYIAVAELDRLLDLDIEENRAALGAAVGAVRGVKGFKEVSFSDIVRAISCLKRVTGNVKPFVVEEIARY